MAKNKANRRKNGNGPSNAKKRKPKKQPPKVTCQQCLQRSHPEMTATQLKELAKRGISYQAVSQGNIQTGAGSSTASGDLTRNAPSFKSVISRLQLEMNEELSQTQESMDTAATPGPTQTAIRKTVALATTPARASEVWAQSKASEEAFEQAALCALQCDRMLSYFKKELCTNCQKVLLRELYRLNTKCEIESSSEEE